MVSIVAFTAVIAAALSTVASNTTSSAFTPPPGAVFVNPLLYNVVGPNYTQWRTNNSFSGFNPTNSAPPFIQFFDPSFGNVTGPNATIRLISENTGFAFAHEAPIYVPDLNLVFFTSNTGGAFGFSGWNNNSVVEILNVTEVDLAVSNLTNTTSVNIPVKTLNLSDTVQMVGGGTGPYKGNLLFVTSGRALLPPSVVLISPSPPNNVTVLLDNFYGRQFNSLNDVKVLPGTDIIYFTDPAYGFLNGFRPEPMLPEQVYRFDPSTGQVQVAADGFKHPNGIAFTPDAKNAFISDTGLAGGSSGNNQTFPATIYQFDINPNTQSFQNRRVFAYADSGIPDGIQLDTNGNVYSGCGDGVHVWNPNGTLIGKFFTNITTPQLVFTKSGLLMLSDEFVFLASIEAKGVNLTTF